MRSRSGKLSKIVSIAASEERHHGAVVGRYRRDLEDHMDRLGELNAYRHSYAEHSRSVKTVGAAQWKDYHTFIDRLDRAVKSQQQIIRDSEQSLESHRRRWMAKRQRLESLQRVLENYRKDEVRHAERLEQRALDDLPAAEKLFEDQGES